MSVCECVSTQVEVSYGALLEGKSKKNGSPFLKDQQKIVQKSLKVAEELAFFVSVNESSPGGGLSIAAKLGIGIGGGAVVLIIIVLLAFAFFQKKRADKAEEHKNPFGMQFLPSILQLWQTIFYIDI